MENGKDRIASTPRQVKGLGGVRAIQAGYDRCLALKDDGTVWAWGSANGFLGAGEKNAYDDVCSAAKVKGLSDIIAIAVGENHFLALKKDGTVYAWGGAFSTEKPGQLGNGTYSTSDTPVRVASLKGIVAIAAHGDFSLALGGDGVVWAWGDNAKSQLGDGTAKTQNLPVRVSGLAGATKIVAGGSCSFAWTKDGAIWAWGDDALSQLGDPGLKSSMVPVRLSRLGP
jgi:alpha-tubulin suppressor-like RCC1 family protein